jgi:dodecin
MTDETIGGVVKVIELVGSSPRSFSDAVRNAVREAGQSLHDLRGVEVLSTTAEIDGNELSNYKAHCKIAFVVNRGSPDGVTRQAQQAASTAAPHPPP